jgi:hypothetical protein
VEAKEEPGHGDHFGVEISGTQFNRAKIQEFWMKW